MADPSDVRIPLPREDLGRRRINAAVVCTFFAAIMAFGFAYILIPKLDAHPKTAYAVAILDEPSGTGRPERFAVTTGKPLTMVEYRAAPGQPAKFVEVISADTVSPYVGRMMRVDGATVQTVPGDKIFSIGPTEGDSILVKMDEPTNPGHQKEHELVVRPGDVVFVVGRLLAMPPESTLKKWGLTDAERSHIGRQANYIKASLVEDVP